MRATDLMLGAYALSLKNGKDLHVRWIDLSHKLAGVTGVAHLPTIQANGELDILLRQLESEWRPEEANVVDHALNLRVWLSKYWVLGAYEIVRAAVEQLRLRRDERDDFSKLKYRLGLVRLPLAKAEIQRAKPSDNLILIRADGADPKPYQKDGSYIVPSGICTNSGAAIWWPANVKTNRSDPISRIELADEMLNLEV